MATILTTIWYHRKVVIPQSLACCVALFRLQGSNLFKSIIPPMFQRPGHFVILSHTLESDQVIPGLLSWQFLCLHHLMTASYYQGLLHRYVISLAFSLLQPFRMGKVSKCFEPSRKPQLVLCVQPIVLWTRRESNPPRSPCKGVPPALVHASP